MDVELVVPAEQGKEVVGLGRGDRERPAPRVAAGEYRRDRAAGEVGDRRGIAIPGRVPCQRGEVGIAPGVDAATLVEQRDERELVEDQHHDGGVGAGLDIERLRLALRDHKAPHGREEQEDDDK
jgi:hypothetical protein